MQRRTSKLVSLLLALTLMFTACTGNTEKEDETTPPSDNTVESTDDTSHTDSTEETQDTDTTTEDTQTDSEPSEDVEPQGPYSDEEVAAFDAFLEAVAIQTIEDSPLNASFTYGDLDAVGLGHLRTELDDFSIEAFQASYEEARNTLADLQAYNYDRLPRDRQISYRMLEFSLQTAVDEEDFLYNYHQFQPSSGAQVNIPLSLAQIELETEQEVKDYLVRITKTDDLFDQTIAYTKAQVDVGHLLPADSYLTVIEQIEGMITTPESFMMYRSFVDQVDALGLDAEVADGYKAECLAIITDEIFPAYDRIKVALGEIAEASTITGGISQWDDGQDFYQYLIKSKTSYDMDVEEYRSLLQREIMKYQTKAQALMKKYPELADPEFDLEGALPSITNFEEIYDYQQAVLDDQFYDYGIENASQHIIPDYLDDYLAAGFYFPVSIDGEDYGNMFLPQDAYDAPDSGTLETYYHENVPGHHMYFAHLYQSDLPLIRKVLGWLAYEEGWAVYVQGKPYQYMDLQEGLETYLYYVGNINSYFFAFLDIMLHVDGTSYEDMIAYLVELGLDQDGAKETVDRMIANPGENIHYMFGYYKMDEYRHQCMDALGDAFDYKSFHDMLLSQGSVPFETMDEIVSDYINEQLGE